MVPVSLFDILELEETSLPGIRLTCQGFSVPDNEENLVWRAAHVFFSLTGRTAGLSITIVKNIPVSAGLGGGSSDAACMLRALNKMYSNPLTTRDMSDLAMNLGADVPFFLESRPCIARGIGEILEPIKKWPKFWYVIVTPDLRVSTSWVYGNLKLKLTTSENEYIIPIFKNEHFDVTHILENDLETVTASHFPAINRMKRALMDAGALGALMSVSGPSVFGIFESNDQALTAEKHLIPLNLGDVFVVEGLGIED